MFVHDVVVFKTFDGESLGLTNRKKEEGKKRKEKRKRVRI